MYMNIIVLVFLALLCIPFAIGVIKAATQGSDKKRRAHAIIALSQMSEEERTVLIGIYSAYKNKDITKANNVVNSARPDVISSLVKFHGFDNRPLEFSSGKAGK